MNPAASTKQTEALLYSLNGVQGSLRVPRLSILYRVGLLAVALAMILLPVVYMALMVAAAWAVFYHLTHHHLMFERNGGEGTIFLLILYFGPAVAGMVLIFFMVKPFLSKRAPVPEPFLLDAAEQPRLFEFVQQICRLTCAPVPQRIEVDCEVNASARLRRGVLSTDLVLTIGLPLVSSLNMCQLAGVLAHEFGHFAQGAGMRMTYIIRSINTWFARAVYERDSWDEALENLARSIDIRFGIVLHAARGCVWLTRQILRGLMYAGHGISCFMLRQMEFDADRYEAKLAGSDAFESTFTTIQLMNVAAQFARNDVHEFWSSSSRLPEDMCLLISFRASRLPADFQRDLAAGKTSKKTSWFDTHPCDQDRITAVQATGEPGIFHAAAPATALFSDFEELSKAVTCHEYRHKLKLEFGEQDLVSSAEVTKEVTLRIHSDVAIQRYYGHVDSTLHPLLRASDLPLLSCSGSGLEPWREAALTGGKLLDSATRASAKIRVIQRQLADATAAHWLTKTGFRVNPKEFCLPCHTTKPDKQEIAARFAIEESSAELAKAIRQVSPFVDALRARVTYALQVGRQCSNTIDSEAEQELSELLPAFVATASMVPRVRETSLKIHALGLLAKNRGNHHRPTTVDTAMSELAAELRSDVSAFHDELASRPYPFTRPREASTIAEYLGPQRLEGSEVHSAYVDAATRVERLLLLHHRLLGRLLSIVASVEESLLNSKLRADLPILAKSEAGC